MRPRWTGTAMSTLEIATGRISKPVQKLSYRIDEAVAASGLPRTCLYDAIAGKALPSFKVGNRRLIMHDDLVAFLQAHREAA